MGRARRGFSRSSVTLFSPTHRHSGIAAALSVAQVSWFAAAPGGKTLHHFRGTSPLADCILPPRRTARRVRPNAAKAAAHQEIHASWVEVRPPDQTHRYGNAFRSASPRFRRSMLIRSARKSRAAFCPASSRTSLSRLVSRDKPDVRTRQRPKRERRCVCDNFDNGTNTRLSADRSQ